MYGHITEDNRFIEKWIFRHQKFRLVDTKADLENGLLHYKHLLNT